MPSTMLIYEYDELSAEAQKQARETWLKYHQGDSYVCDMITADFKITLEEMGLPTGVYWSLGNCQGDGVAFEGIVDLEKYTRVHELRGWGPVEDFFHVEITNRGRYSHWNSMYVTIEGWEMDDHPSAWWCYRFADPLHSHVVDRIKEVSRELEKTGYAELEYQSSDECAADHLLDCSWKFTEEGEHIETECA